MGCGLSSLNGQRGASFLFFSISNDGKKKKKKKKDVANLLIDPRATICYQRDGMEQSFRGSGKADRYRPLSVCVDHHLEPSRVLFSFTIRFLYFHFSFSFCLLYRHTSQARKQGQRGALVLFFLMYKFQKRKGKKKKTTVTI